jgi:hypothetical protein
MKGGRTDGRHRPTPYPRPRAVPAIDTEARDDATVRVPATLRMFCVFVIVCGAVSSAWFTYSAIRDWSAMDGDGDLANASAVDEVTGQVRQVIPALFSFDPDAAAKTDEAAFRWLSPGAAEEYKVMFGSARRNAQTHRFTVETAVAAVGMERLHGGEAGALVFARQTVGSASSGRTETKNVQFDVVLSRTAGQWTISQISLVS